MVHYNTATGELKFVDYYRGNWLAPYTIATQGHDVGEGASLAVDALGRGHISYFDATNNFLLYARYNSDSNWYMNTLDSSGTAKAFSILACNPVSNEPAVGYLLGTSLYYSMLSGTSWSIPNVIDTGLNFSNPGYRSFGMALASDGAPHFAYRKGNDLWYTFWNGSNWSRSVGTIVDSDAEEYFSLALDRHGTPHLACLAFGSGQGFWVDYITRQGAAWRVQKVDLGGNLVSTPSIAISPGGRPRIAFHDINEHLKFLLQLDTAFLPFIRK